CCEPRKLARNPKKRKKPAASILVSSIFMAEQINCVVFYEGDEDRVVLQGLAKIGLLQSHWQIVKRETEEKRKFSGWTGMVKQFAGVIAPGVPSRAVVLIDFDAFQPDQLLQRVVNESVKHLPKGLPVTPSPDVAHPRLRKLTVSGDGHERRVVMVPV